MATPDSIEQRAHKIVSSLLNKPRLLHAVSQALQEMEFCRGWEDRGALKKVRCTFKGKRVVVVRPNEELGWETILSRVVLDRHPAHNRNGPRNRTFPSMVEAMGYADDTLKGANYILVHTGDDHG